MTSMRVNKTEAARRQVDAAIRMLFHDEDPVAIHTVIAAAFWVLRDLAKQHEDTPFLDRMESRIMPGMEKEFWKQASRPANFFKHADKDPDDILDNVSEEANGIMILMAVMVYRDLGHSLTPEMSGFFSWYALKNPKILRDDNPGLDLMRKMDIHTDLISQAEWLALGLHAIETARQNPRR